MTDGEILLVLLGLTAITVVTRSFFFLSRREPVLPELVRRGLRYAPLAALAAVVVPELVLNAEGAFIQTWRDPRLFAAAAGAAYFFWQRGLLGTILVGMVVLLGLKALWG